jgi:uncharacterized protein YceH (UPF0502 family)
MPRRPGQKEERFRQVLDAEQPEGEGAVADGAERTPDPERGAPALDALLARVARLEREVAELKAGPRDGMRDPSGQQP